MATTAADAAPPRGRISLKPELFDRILSAAALVLLEHHWAVGLRDAVAGAGGFRLSDGFISPLDLVEVGLLTAEEAAAHHEFETAGASSK